MSDEIEALAKGGTAIGELAGKLFPGIAARSIDRASSASVHNAMSDIDDVLAWADKQGIPPELRATVLNLVFEKRGSDQRVADCLTFAAPQIEEDANPENLDQEWLDYWRVHAEKSRDEDVQAIWGAILAGEINNAGSVSKRAMSILADMEKRDADAFVSLCSCCMGGPLGNGEEMPPTPMFIEPNERFAQDPESIARLKSLGLVDFTITRGMSMRSAQSIDCRNGEIVRIGDSTYSLWGNGQAKLTIVSYPFTEYGLQIAKYCSLGTGNGFSNEMISHFKSKGFKVGKILEWLDGNQYRYQLI